MPYPSDREKDTADRELAALRAETERKRRKWEADQDARAAAEQRDRRRYPDPK